MKRLFIVALAAFALASCAKDEEVNVASTNGIGFQPSVVNGTRATVTTDNLRRFEVKGIHNDTDILMNNVIVARSEAEDGTVSWVYDPVQYWPNSGYVDFYAFGVPLYVKDTEGWHMSASTHLDMEGTQTNSGRKSGYMNLALRDPNNDGLYRGIADITYATAMSETKKNTPVQLFFRHAMSQLVFQFKNTNEKLKVYVEDMHVVNLLNGGRYSLPIETTTRDNDAARGSWSFDDVTTNFTVGNVTFDADINASSDNWIEVPSDGTLVPYTDVMATTIGVLNTGERVVEDGHMNVIPHTVTPWDYENDKTNEKGGSYFLIKVKLMNDNACLWPRLEEGQTGADAGTDWVAVPFKFSDTTTTLEEGKRYVITFIFGDGAGIIPPTDGTDPGEPILAPIHFTVEVEDYVEVGYDYDLGELQPEEE